MIPQNEIRRFGIRRNGTEPFSVAQSVVFWLLKNFHTYVYVRQMAAQNNANHFGDVFKTNHNRKRLPTLTK